MAAPNPDLSLDDMLKLSRQKKENEKFAQSIFGRDRRSSAPGSLGKRRGGIAPSLASRVGVKKTAQRAKSNRDLFKAHANSSARPSPLKQELGSGGPLAARIGNAPPAQPKAQFNMNIRGLAGPAIVMGTNFAPGTTAADIQSAMEPVGGQMTSCRVVSARPTVIAEMVFADRAGAEAVIETFNNQKADGRLLHIYLKTGPGSQTPAPPAAARSDFGRASEPARSQTSSIRNEGRDLYDQSSRDYADAQPGYQDGRYGFDDVKQDMDVEMDDQRDDRGNHRSYGDGRRDDRLDDRREDYRDDQRGNRPYQSQNGHGRRYNQAPRDGRLYSDRLNYRGRGFR